MTMKRLRILAAGMAIALMGCTNNATPETQAPIPSREIQPNVQFEVEATSGNCPETVGLWSFLLGFEGGADHTVIADTQAIAAMPVQLVTSEERRVVYEAPLQEAYATCVGQAQSDALTMYDFQFGEGKVRFQLDVTQDDGYREVLYTGVSASRPYIHWRATE